MSAKNHTTTNNFSAYINCMSVARYMSACEPKTKDNSAKNILLEILVEKQCRACMQQLRGSVVRGWDIGTDA